MSYPILDLGRYMIIVAVFGSMVAAFACLIYGAAEVLLVIVRLFKADGTKKGAKSLSVSFLADVDLFLLGTVFYIVAMGLYELFINQNPQAPPWLVIHDLDDLKPKLIDGVVLFLAIHFLQQLVDWDKQTDLLRISISMAVIIAALALFEFATGKGGRGATAVAGVEARQAVVAHQREHP